ncbi:MAG: Tfp pilus assembly protein PilF, partial [Saprospiraceae bacterium]
NAYAFGKAPGEAVQFGLNALSHHPEDDYIYFGLGVASMRMGFPSQAEDYFKDAIRFQQWQPAYHANLAIALKERGHWEAAEIAINKALELHPDYDFAHNVKAQILKKLKPKQAENNINEAIRLSPENDYHHQTKGRHAFEEKDYVQSAFHYQQAVRLDPMNVSVRNEFLRTLVRTHPNYLKLVKRYPFADANIWKQILTVIIIAITLLSLQFLFGQGVYSILLSIPFIAVAAVYWFGEPYARHQLFASHFKQKDYALANVNLTLQTLMQMCIVALGFVVLTGLVVFNVLVASSLVTALLYAFMTDNLTGEIGRLHIEKPWTMTFVWCGFALLVPVLILFGGEKIATEGMS